MRKMNIIEMKNVFFSYTANHPVIEDLNLSIKKGQFVTILGHNGSGKSTIAKLLIGLLKAKKGTIIIEEQELSETTVDQIRKKIGIVFQNPDNQFVGVTVKDDIAFGLENRQVDRKKMLALIDEYSSLVAMNDFLEKDPESLSGGEKQRVAIAGVLAINPDIIIFDESTSMLDPKGTKEVNKVIYELKEKLNKTIIMITHNLEEAKMSDRVIVLNKGKVVADGTPFEVFSQKDILVESQLDILESMKLIEAIEKNLSITKKEELVKSLWELTFKE
jgi:energy-coupling factor transport system ATP-binding protein